MHTHTHTYIYTHTYNGSLKERNTKDSIQPHVGLSQIYMSLLYIYPSICANSVTNNAISYNVAQQLEWEKYCDPKVVFCLFCFYGHKAESKTEKSDAKY